MRKQWVHPEYTIRYARPSYAVSQIPAARTFQIGERFERSGVTAFLFSALIALAITIPVTIYKARFSGSTMVVTRVELPPELSKMGADNKELFLSLVSARERREIASQVHYVGEIVKSFGRYPKEWRDIAAAIVMESRRADVDPLLVTALIKSESTFNRFALSNRGAVGLMQLLPDTGRYISNLSQIGWHGAGKLNDLEYNLRLGIAYMKYLRRYFGNNLEHVLIAYNWGPGNLLRAIKERGTIYEPSVHYARTILSNQARWRREYSSRKDEFQYIKVANLAVG